MIVVRSVSELRRLVSEARHRSERVGLVPTMGAFHEGHVSLMRRAGQECGFVVVSLFVNPAQFNDAGDLARYPRDEAHDASLAEGAGVHVLYAPPVSVVYPDGFTTTVEVRGLSTPLEGVVRGTEHFRGVTTVVAKLFNMVQPDHAFFGQKDAQQALIIRRMVADLDIPVRIEICATVREPDGLAMSSRNALLDAEARARAPVLSRALFAASSLIARGETSASTALDAGRRLLADAGVDTEYFDVVSTVTLTSLERVSGEVLIVIAARVGNVRLIDNVLVHLGENAR
ncbi:MAG: Pantothenate synthetase [Gemmatimonadetes bacterium]|nr:Pantothenate synthetase [Gemmatimonadota bacterium]